MIYIRPDTVAPIDQGDLFAQCPIATIERFDPQDPGGPLVNASLAIVVVLTQTCDLAQARTSRATVAIAHSAEELINQGRLKSADVRGPIRSARVYGWYFLPSSSEFGIPELIVDFRNLHTVSISVLDSLRSIGFRKGRVLSPYREHLAKHFADTYSRIGLPEPYQTE